MPSTKGLKSGDLIIYNDGYTQFPAFIISITSTQKAQIKPLIDVNETFNTKYIINTYRKFMTIAWSAPT
jgi:hypothetical protein